MKFRNVWLIFDEATLHKIDLNHRYIWIIIRIVIGTKSFEIYCIFLVLLVFSILELLLEIESMTFLNNLVSMFMRKKPNWNNQRKKRNDERYHISFRRIFLHYIRVFDFWPYLIVCRKYMCSNDNFDILANPINNLIRTNRNRDH